MNWLDLEPVDASASTDFDLESIDNLWYRQLDYGPFLRQQLVTPADKDRVEAFMNEHGPLRLIKSSIVQMACSTQSLLVTMPYLIRILKEHQESNPGEMEGYQNAGRQGGRVGQAGQGSRSLVIERV